MRRIPSFIICFLFLVFLASCAPASSGALFFYIRQGATPTLILLDSPEAASPRDEIALAPPPDCKFWSLTPAPRGPLAAVEWQCSFGLVTQLVNTQSKRISSLLDDPNGESHFLAWSADGKSIYLKVAATSDPKILRVSVESRLVTVLSISPNTYNMTVAPKNDVLLWAFSDGIGLGSQIWGAETNEIKPQIIFSDPGHIISFMRYAPDGKRIAAIRIPDGRDPFPAGSLWLADSDGKHAHFVAITDGGRGMFPVWSPNGEKIAYIGRNKGSDPSSINLSILTVSEFNPAIINIQPALPPLWAPDGSGVYVTLPADGKMDLWFYEISTGKSKKLFDNACCAGWIFGDRK